MIQFGFKKLLSLLTTLTLVTSASINIVACGNNEKTNSNKKNNNTAKYTYYGINDKYYYSKQEALDDQIQKNVKIDSEFDLLKDITLGEKEYQTFEQMYDAIAKDYDTYYSNCNKKRS